MQASGLHRRNPAFVNHTPRYLGEAVHSNARSPEMFGPYGFGTGSFYTATNMAQTPSTLERDSVRKPSTTILREDSIQVEEGPSEISRPDSWSLHHACTNQAPYITDNEGNMMTSTSLVGKLPKGNASRDLAFFLTTTGPIAPHRRPSRVEHPGRATSARKSALKFLRIGHKKAQSPRVSTHEELEAVQRREGAMLMPSGVEQKETSGGRKYLALQVPEVPAPQEQPHTVAVESEPSAHVMESRVSISFAEDINTSEVLDNWLYKYSKEPSFREEPTPPRKSSTHLPIGDDIAVRAVAYSSSPIRPAASDPPTPQPESAVSMAEAYRSDLIEHPAKRSFEIARALSSLPVQPPCRSATVLPGIALPREEVPVRHVGSEKHLDIKHPSPRRFASHPVLQRAPSVTSSPYLPGGSDSPGPPPPRSPLRLTRDPQIIEGIIASHNSAGESTPKLAPSVLNLGEYSNEVEPIKGTVTTDCTGPIKRPKSRHQNPVTHPAYPASRKEREGRSRARKLRDRPQVSRAIDAIIHVPSPVPRQRLRKARPQIQIPDLRPAPLVTRASSSASSNASWKKVTQSTRTPVSPVPSQDTPVGDGEKTGYTPVSPTTSRESSMALSPVMLVAEEVPPPKARSTPKPAKIVLERGKTYVPRPRSASMSRDAKRRSRTSMQTPPRSTSPHNHEYNQDNAPPLPSPPPNRALPPTPPVSGSEKWEKLKATEAIKKDLPVLPTYEIAPRGATLVKTTELLPHVATQAQRKSTASKESSKASRIDARLDALERHNALLEAALMAVLKTNGSLNGSRTSAVDDAAIQSARRPMCWEERIARKTAANHQASSSNGSALDMYMGTRRESRYVP